MVIELDLDLVRRLDGFCFGIILSKGGAGPQQGHAQNEGTKAPHGNLLNARWWHP